MVDSSTDKAADVGMDGATPVTQDYGEGEGAFTGKTEDATAELI